MNKEDLGILFQKLDTIIRLVAGNLLKDAKTKTEKIEILTALGITTKEIAQLVGGSEATVDVLKNRLKHKKTSRRVMKSGTD